MKRFEIRVGVQEAACVLLLNPKPETRISNPKPETRISNRKPETQISNPQPLAADSRGVSEVVSDHAVVKHQN